MLSNLVGIHDSASKHPKDRRTNWVLTKLNLRHKAAEGAAKPESEEKMNTSRHDVTDGSSA